MLDQRPRCVLEAFSTTTRRACASNSTGQVAQCRNCKCEIELLQFRNWVTQGWRSSCVPFGLKHSSQRASAQRACEMQDLMREKQRHHEAATSLHQPRAAPNLVFGVPRATCILLRSINKSQRNNTTNCKGIRKSLNAQLYSGALPFYHCYESVNNSTRLPVGSKLSRGVHLPHAQVRS